MKSKFLLLICGLVILALGGMIYVVYNTDLTKSSTDSGNLPVIMSLTPSSGTFKVDDTFNVNITLNTGGNAVVGAQAYLNYDPTKLEVLDQDIAKVGTQVEPGTIFGAVMSNAVSNGKITFSAVSVGTQPKYTGTGILATIKFKALAASTTEVTFNFTAGSTGETTLVGKDAEHQNILSSVANGSFDINYDKAKDD